MTEPNPRFYAAIQANGAKEGYYVVGDRIAHTTVGSYLLQSDAQRHAEHLNSFCQPCGCMENDDLGVMDPCFEHGKKYLVTHTYVVFATTQEDARIMSDFAAWEELPSHLLLAESAGATELNYDPREMSPDER